MIQLVPSSQTSVAHLPAVAARIAVPAVADVRGLTLDDAEITVYVPDRFLIVTVRPM